MVSELSHRRSTKSVRCCTFTRDCRYVGHCDNNSNREHTTDQYTSQVICAGEDGFIWRYDYIDDATLQEWANWKKAQ